MPVNTLRWASILHSPTALNLCGYWRLVKRKPLFTATCGCFSIKSNCCIRAMKSLTEAAAQCKEWDCDVTTSLGSVPLLFFPIVIDNSTTFATINTSMTLNLLGYLYLVLTSYYNSCEAPEGKVSLEFSNFFFWIVFFCSLWYNSDYKLSTQLLMGHAIKVTAILSASVRKVYHLFPCDNCC